MLNLRGQLIPDTNQHLAAGYGNDNNAQRRVIRELTNPSAGCIRVEMGDL